MRPQLLRPAGLAEPAPGATLGLSKALTGTLAIVALLLHGLPLLHRGASVNSSSGGFVVQTITAPAAAPVYREEFIDPDPPVPFSHVPSLCELAHGRLGAVWYAGSREGARDVTIYLATREPEAAAWSKPRAIMTREQAERDLYRRIKKVGNSVVFSDRAGNLWLVYVTISMGGWSGSSLNLTRSSDEGLTWSGSERLTLNPFLNVGELVRNRPDRLLDGSWLVPIHQEFLGHLPELLWLRDSQAGASATKSRILGAGGGYQPALVPLNTNSALVFLRDFDARNGIAVTRTTDTAADWSPPTFLGLPNPDSGVAALRLANGRLLLVFVDSYTKPGDLCLAGSRGEGQPWTRLATLAPTSKGEGNYPFIIQTEDGQIHVAYTWKMRAIKHVIFNEAWLNSLPGWNRS